MYVLHVPSIDARTCTMYRRTKLPAAGNTYLLRYVRTYCTYLVLVYLLAYVRTYCIYCYPYRCMYVSTVCTALTNAISVHNCCIYCTLLLYVQLMISETYCPSPAWYPPPCGHRCKVLGDDTGESDGDITRNSACE